MKRSFIALLTFVSIAQISAQTSFYLLYNNACMEQLEYRYAYSGNSVVAFSAKTSPTEQYIFTAGTGSITANALPKGTVDCRGLKFNDDFVDAVNRLDRPMYIVQQTQTGYLLTPVVSATRVFSNGSVYYVRSLNYNFAFDTTALSPQTNLAIAGSNSYVYYRGVEIRGCRFQYAFHRDPVRAGMERSDFSFISGIGITSERTGLNSAQAEANQVWLWTINGRLVDDHLTLLCNGQKPPVSTALSGTGGGGGMVGPAQVENREEAVLNPGSVQPGLPVQPGNPGNYYCPQPPGVNYHIVQRGETLNSLSRMYNVPVKTLISLNKISAPDKIAVCQRVNLPKGKASVQVSKSGAPGVAQYSTGRNPQPQYAAPGPYMPAPTLPAGRPIHLVKSGETLSTIARLYGYTEERFRAMNGLPINGIIQITPGMQLVASDCDCEAQTQAAAPAATTPAPSTPPANQSPAVAEVAPRPIESSTPTTARPTPANTEVFSETPVTGANATNTPAVTRPENNSTVIAGSPVETIDATPPAKKTAPAFLEHYVQQGETIGSLAVKYRVNAQEIALANGKEVNETLIAGQRLLIPKE